MTTLVVSGIGTCSRPAGAEPDGTWFDQRAVLGRGYKHVPKASQYLLAASAKALADSGADFAAVPEERRAVAVGTNHGVSTVHGEFDRAVIERRAELLSPLAVPYFSINLVGSRVAMEHSLRGFSLGTHSPVIAGLEALGHGSRAVAVGRADWLLAGAAEAAPDIGEPTERSIEDGAVVFVVEPAEAVEARGATGYGRCRTRSLLLPVTGDAGVLLDSELAALLGTDRPEVTLVGDDSVAALRVAEALGVDLVPAGNGCLRPMAEIARLLYAGGAEHLVVAVAAEGNVALTHVVPNRKEHP